MPLKNNGYRDVVVFLFYRNGEVLVENRPDGRVFLPGGTVEKKDFNKPGSYLMNALYREVNEEFSGRVRIKRCGYYATRKSKNEKINFHAFAITDWEGRMPEYTIEDGKRFSKLEWVELDSYADHLTAEHSRKMCEKLKDMLDAAA